MKLRRLFVAALLVGAAFPLAATPAACAGERDRAALVVDLGEEGDVFRYCVALPEPQVSGIELIKLANEQYGLTYRLGYDGMAVCMLAGVGPTEGECFGDYPYFWAYWRGDGSGGWTMSNLGAGSTVVEDGDVEGWSWGTGDDGDSHPKPPPTTFGSVCPKQAAEDAKQRERDKAPPVQQTPAAQPSETEADAGARKVAEKEAPEPDEKRPGKRKKRDRGKQRKREPEMRTRPSEEPTVEASPQAPVAAAEPTSAVPVAGVIALAGGASVVGVALFRRRRRS